ncbi:MAG: methyltransferase [Candidatus Hermodarchaeota archaeon]
MSVLFILTIITVFMTIFVESILLILQFKGRKLTQWFGKYAFFIHSIITLTFWALSFLFLGLLQLEEHPLFHNELLIKYAGVIVLAVGLVVAIWGFKLLGLKRSLCLNFFKDDVPVVKSSLYKYIKNPEDIGLWTMLIGFALLTGSIYNLIIAVEFIMTMIPHERVENMPLKTV